MKTLILLVAAVNDSISLSLVRELQNYLGIKNTTIDQMVPGCIYNGVLDKKERNDLETYIRDLVDTIGILFIESEDLDEMDECPLLTYEKI